jgi:integrase
MFTWAVQQDMIDTSPFEGLGAPAKETSRDRVLTDAELCSVWRAAGKTDVDPVYRSMMRMLILTGARRGEVAGLTWDEIDLKTRQWTLPAPRAKNGRAHIIPLSRQAITVLNAVPRLHERYIFSANGKHAIGGFSQPKDRLNALCGFSDWTVHDLRRTTASGMARIGISLPVIERVLNHISGSFAGVAGIYQRHDFAAEKRAALDAWGKHVAAIVSDKGGRR